MTVAVSVDNVVLWHDEVRARLNQWAAWSRGHQVVRGARHVLATMMQKAAGEVPGTSATGYDFTLEIQAVDRAIAQMRVQAIALGGRSGREMKRARSILLSVYLGRRTVHELAEKYDCSIDYVRSRLWEAESFVGAKIPEMEKHLKLRQKKIIVRTV